MGSVHEGDVGTRLRFNFKELVGGVKVAVDISTSTVRTCTIKPPRGAAIERDLEITNSPGTDGLAHYDLVDGDIPAGSRGTWKAQGYVEMPGGDWHADAVSFAVLGNL